MGRKSHEILVFLFFLCVAFGFWFLQTLNETFEVELAVPLRLKNVPEGVLITTELPPRVNVMVRDRGTSLIRFYRKDELPPVEVDFGKYDNGASSGRVQVANSEVQHALQSILDATTTILSIRPDTLEYYYNRGMSRRMAVKPCGTLSTTPQNYLQGIKLSPDSVTVYAPSSVLDTMQYAYTQAVSMTDMSESITRQVSLRSIKGIKYEPGEVELTAQVGYYTEKTVEVPVKGLNFPADKGLRTFPATARITFRVGSAMYQNVTAENFVLAVTYEELLQNESPKYRPHLRSLPEGVSNVRISPVEMDYLIEQIDTEEQKQ